MKMNKYRLVATFSLVLKKQKQRAIQCTGIFIETLLAVGGAIMCSFSTIYTTAVTLRLVSKKHIGKIIIFQL